MAVVLSIAGMGFAQAPGEATYKAKCQMCHGASGEADTAMGKATKTLPLSDPTVNKISEAEMAALTRDGKGKMMPFKDKLTEAEIKDAVAYYRSLLKK